MGKELPTSVPEPPTAERDCTLTAEAPDQFKKATEEAQLRKINLEVTWLKWQNSLIGRLTQFATIFAVFAGIATLAATLFGVWQGYEKFRSDNKRDRELREGELSQKIDNQYRSDINQLLQFPIDEKQTIPLTIFLFQDLHELIELKSQRQTSDPTLQQQIKEKLGSELASLLYNLVKSSDYDLATPRNVEFDATALRYWEYYSASFGEQPQRNRTILTKYKHALKYIHDHDSACYESVLVIQTGIDFIQGRPPKDSKEYVHFLKLFLAYKAHVELMKKHLDANPGDTQTKEDLETVGRWFYEATNNPSLTNHIFGTRIPIKVNR